MKKEEYKPYRFSADLSQIEGDHFVMIKLGFYWYSLRGIWEFWRYAKLIFDSTKRAEKEGLLKSEYFLYSQNHAGFIQYWSSFKALEQWAAKNKDHSDWWKEMESQNKWKDFGMYHEVYVLDKNKVETVYNIDPKTKKTEFPGLGAFLPHLAPTKYRARDRFIEDPKE